MRIPIKANQQVRGSPGDALPMIGGQVIYPTLTICSGEQGHVRRIILPLVFFLIGLAIGVSGLWRKAPKEMVSQTTQPRPVSTPGVTTKPPLAANVVIPPPAAPVVDTAVVEAIKRVIPNVASTSVETGNRLLRKAAVAEYEHAAHELGALQQKAEQDLTNLSEQQRIVAALAIEERQAEKMAKLQQIAANAQAQINAFQKLKEATQ